MGRKLLGTSKVPKKSRIEITDKDREEIKTMASYGSTNEMISSVKSIPISTLKRHCREELTKGRDGGCNKILETAFHIGVVEKDVRMLIFLMKTRCHMRETAPIQDEQSIKTIVRRKVDFGTDPIEASRRYQDFIKGVIKDE